MIWTSPFRISLPIFKRNLLRLSSSFVSDLDIDYYCNFINKCEIENNITKRKGIGNISTVLEKYNLLQTLSDTDRTYETVKSELTNELLNLPNRTHPAVQSYDVAPQLVKAINKKKDLGSQKYLNFDEITQYLHTVRTDNLGQTCGQKSYYFMGELAELEEALVKYTVSYLMNQNFQFVSVPDILNSRVLKSCGMNLNSDRTQIYTLDADHHGPDLCLSGTAEMALAGLLEDTKLNYTDLPFKLAAVSRCYRAETSNIVDERGLYRVHQFTKVEMFMVTRPEASDNALEYIRNIQEELFTPLGIYMKVLDMPPHELGASAYRKYDYEAWLPGRSMFGEISSCSNCTDYQSRRLGIKYTDEYGSQDYVHTLNGTACAIPRMVIALIETHQTEKGKVEIPQVLQPYMSGKEYMSRNTEVPQLKLLKIKK